MKNVLDAWEVLLAFGFELIWDKAWDSVFLFSFQAMLNVSSHLPLIRKLRGAGTMVRPPQTLTSGPPKTQFPDL